MAFLGMHVVHAKLPRDVLACSLCMLHTRRFRPRRCLFRLRGFGIRSNQTSFCRFCVSLLVSCVRGSVSGGGGGGRSAHPQGCTRVAEVGGNKGIAVPKFKASVTEVQVKIVFSTAFSTAC